MKKHQIICQQLLESKQHGFSILRHYKNTWKPRVFRLALLLLAIWFLFQTKDSAIYLALLLAIGMLIGAIVEDFAYMRKAKQFWGLNKKIINWDKVKEIADRE